MKPTLLAIAASLAMMSAPLLHAANGVPIASPTAMPANAPVKHVLLISIDGMHASDLQHFIAQYPNSVLAGLAKQGIDYTNAFTTEPSDSFPGMVALATGGTPAVTGVYYDDSYDRLLAAPGTHCATLGTRVLYNEGVDRPDAEGHGVMDPAKLPLDPRTGCVPVFPHSYLRVNTLFEVVRAAGGYTAWTDKHPTYDILNGPSGRGVDDLFVPEIGSNYEGLSTKRGPGITSSLTKTEDYDDMKGLSVINEIEGKTHDGSASAPVPNVMGFNLQELNIAQKLYGYKNANADLTPGVEEAMRHSDALIGRLVDALAKQDLRNSTLIIVTAKHGNGPTNPALLQKISPKKLAQVIDDAMPGALAHMTPDDGVLVWLKGGADASNHVASEAQTAHVVAALRANAKVLGIADVLSGSRLAMRFASPQYDSRVPDLIIIAHDGVIYTSPKSGKLVEHGGFHDDDRHVGLLVSNPQLANSGSHPRSQVSLTQVAPTILSVLGLSPRSLQAVAEQGTKDLPDVIWKR